jgi:hypothetical protein
MQLCMESNVSERLVRACQLDIRVGSRDPGTSPRAEYGTNCTSRFGVVKIQRQNSCRRLRGEWSGPRHVHSNMGMPTGSRFFVAQSGLAVA